MQRQNKRAKIVIFLIQPIDFELSQQKNLIQNYLLLMDKAFMNSP
jgi:hypothetical protein